MLFSHILLYIGKPFNRNVWCQLVTRGSVKCWPPLPHKIITAWYMYSIGGFIHVWNQTFFLLSWWVPWQKLRTIIILIRKCMLWEKPWFEQSFLNQMKLISSTGIIIITLTHLLNHADMKTISHWGSLMDLHWFFFYYIITSDLNFSHKLSTSIII